MPAADPLDWNDLRYFLRAVQLKTLAGAARAMGVDHATVGRRLSALERSLGAPLVIRGPDGLHPTPLGESLLPLAEQVERAVLAFHDRATQQPSRVRLALPTGFTKLFTAELARLRSDHPQLSLDLLSGARPADLRKGEADLAIRSGPVLDEDLVARTLCESGWSLYASPAYLTRRPPPLDPNDLNGHDVIGYDPSLAAVPAAKWIAERAHNATVVLRSREMTDMLAAALSGAGLAVLPCLLGDEEAGLVRLTPSVLATREVSLVYPREARLAPPVQAVIRFVVEVMRENADRVSGVPRGT
ncbi:LysR family transcriptional regulator [Piscinibacter sp.]|uniref:LysR family transcriptional regulator n=1 Tax=Piscinibacter sp. TaxID=1903157 RepID=UPI002B5695C9|nr:LysR family transcriptional regulator [Albitalea sp.]HUG26635.1 LysR family transcriptional regulator [Albitalea sp.]